MSSNSEEENNIKSGNIVGQLLQARTEGEKSEKRSSKVIVDEDGNKVVQVRKRKRVYAESDDHKKNGASFKNILLTVSIGVVVLILIFGVLLVFRLSSFNSEDYRAQKERELSDLWGAEVKLEGVKVEGFSFTVGNLEARFPEDSLIKSVHIRNLKGDLIPSSFVTGVLQGDQLFASSSKMVLRNNIYEMKVPLANGNPLWRFQRYLTDSFELEFENPKEGPFLLNSELYIRKAQNDVHVVQLKGQLRVKGWSPINIQVSAPSLHVSKTGIDNFTINGFFGKSSPVSLNGSIPNGASIFSQSFKLEGSEIPLEMLTKGLFKTFLTANLGSVSDSGNEQARLNFTLPASDMALPGFGGYIEHVTGIELQRLPIFRQLATVLASGLYTKPLIQNGKLELYSNGHGVRVTNIDFEEPGYIKLTGQIAGDVDKELSGRLNVGIPFRNTIRETYDPDPLFVESDGETAWVRLIVSGTADNPRDNSAELAQKADEVRKTRHNTELLDPATKQKAREISEAPIPAPRPAGATDGATAPDSRGTTGGSRFDDLLR